MPGMPKGGESAEPLRDGADIRPVMQSRAGKRCMYVPEATEGPGARSLGSGKPGGPWCCDVVGRSACSHEVVVCQLAPVRLSPRVA